MADARSWLAGRPVLTGRPLAEAEAEVGGAGLRPRVIRPGQAITLAFVPDRVTLTVDATETVTSVRAG